MIELLKQAIVELLRDGQSQFYELFIEVLEEIGLANAIRKGRRNELMSEEYINQILAEYV